MVWPYFADADGLPFVFRNRVLCKGAGIRQHQRDKDEVYDVLFGQDNFVHAVDADDAMLTRTSSTQALQLAGRGNWR